MHRLILSLTIITMVSPSFAEKKEYRIWPGDAPGERQKLPPEKDITTEKSRTVAGRRVIRLGNVSSPTLQIFRPADGQANGTSVIICPGGGHNILAYDLEGTEVAEWLTTIGVTGIVLKYRVPAREKKPRYRAAVQDAQRAVSYVRAHAKAWQIDAKRIGICGFSAGGETAARTSLWGSNRTYKPVDDFDKLSCRPDFSMLIYPAYLADKATGKLKADVSVPDDAPPTFFVHAFDDPVTPLSSVLLFAELKKKGVQSEIHVYSEGGHGYGLRKTEQAVTTWPDRAKTWLEKQGLLGE